MFKNNRKQKPKHHRLGNVEILARKRGWPSYEGWDQVTKLQRQVNVFSTRSTFLVVFHSFLKVSMFPRIKPQVKRPRPYLRMAVFVAVHAGICFVLLIVHIQINIPSSFTYHDAILNLYNYNFCKIYIFWRMSPLFLSFESAVQNNLTTITIQIFSIASYSFPKQFHKDGIEVSVMYFCHNQGKDYHLEM